MAEEVKRGRGRPKGSKNKPKEAGPPVKTGTKSGTKKGVQQPVNEEGFQVSTTPKEEVKKAEAQDAEKLSPKPSDVTQKDPNQVEKMPEPQIPSEMQEEAPGPVPWEV